MIAVGLALSALAPAVLVARHRYAMVTVDGPSMQPALGPGDRVLIRRHRTGRIVKRRIRAGQLVVARKPWPGQRWSEPQPGPRAGATWLIKRVADAGPAGDLLLLGDNAAQSWDSRQWGRCPPGKVHGVVIAVFRTAGARPSQSSTSA
jgi:signal peptidase I